jgi:surfeit locus 1 family protein
MEEDRIMSFPVLGVRPRLVPTLFVGLALVILLGLGTWQVERLAWKTKLIDTIAQRMSASPRPITGTQFGAVTEYERVKVEGRFLNDRELHMLARSRKGNEIGYQVLTPFEVAGGGMVFVNRGFVPSGRRDPATRPEGQINGTTTVTGIARFPKAPLLTWVIPKNRPEDDFWIWADLPRMAEAAGVGTVAPFTIEADAGQSPGGLPIGGQTLLKFPNDHLQYALTWYALAVALIVMFIVHHRRRLGKPEEGRSK